MRASDSLMNDLKRLNGNEKFETPEKAANFMFTVLKVGKKLDCSVYNELFRSELNLIWVFFCVKCIVF